MDKKPSYAELDQNFRKLTSEAIEHDRVRKELEGIFDFSADMIGSGNLQGYFTRINASFKRILGYAKKEILAHPFLVFVHDEDLEKTKEALSDAVKGKRDIYIQNRYRCKDGSYKWIEWKVRTIAKENRFIAVGREITERKRAEKLIEETLAEKEELLREVHHRVKNNFEVISSLLDLSSMQTENEEIQHLWKTARARIHSMAMIHDQLYQTACFDRVDVNRHIQKLMDYLSFVYSDPNSSIDLQINAPEVKLSVTQAIPCALVLNELISNAFKHAFRERKKGTIRVSVNNSDGETVSISVKDDGAGISRDIDMNGARGLGFKLARHLVEGQLNGEMRVTVDKGTEIRVKFKKTKRSRSA